MKTVHHDMRIAISGIWWDAGGDIKKRWGYIKNKKRSSVKGTPQKEVIQESRKAWIAFIIPDA